MSPIPVNTTDLLSSELNIVAGANSNFATALSNVTAVPCSNQPNVLQWQSALWAVIALGLNAMTQRSGGDMISSPYIISLIRSSPIICGVDTLSSIIWLLVGWYYGESPTSSIRLMSMGTKLGMGDDEVDKPSGGKVELETLPVIGIIFFILGPLPQAIKLAGVSGASLETAIGMVFTISYLLRVWELYLHKHARRPRPAPKMPWNVRHRLKEMVNWLYVLGYTMQAVTWFGICAGLLPTRFGRSLSSSENEESFGDMFYLVSMGLLTPSIFLLCTVYSIAKKYIGRLLGRWYSNSVSANPGRVGKVLHECLLHGPPAVLGALCVPLLLFILHFLWGYGEDRSHNVDSSRTALSDALSTTLGTLTLFLTFLGCIFSAVVVGMGLGFLIILVGAVLLPYEKPGKHKFSEEEIKTQNDEFGTIWLNLGFAVCNLFFGVVYYAFVYSPVGTSKPSWSDMLG